MNKNKIAYKVVKKRTRKSAIIGNRSDKMPDNSKPALTYFKGAEVTAIKWSLGIFCFDSILDALHFRNFDEGLIIIRVKPIGRAFRPKYIADVCRDDLANFYKRRNISKRSYSEIDGVTIPPTGTVCYKSVKVLE